MSTNKKNVLITGSSRGIGAALAVAFAKENYSFVGINYNRDAAGAKNVAKEVRELGVQAEIYCCDVSESRECEKMLAKFIQDAGWINVLINNAGGAQTIPSGGFENMPMDYWDKQIRINLSSAAYCSQLAIKNMIDSGICGRIVNISSIHSQVTWVKRKLLPYCAAKSGLNMFTKALGVEVAKYGINVNCIAPGFIATKLTTRYNENEIKDFKRKIPAGRLGSVDDIIPLALLLADEKKSKFIVGQTFIIDGGQSIDGAIDSMMYDF